MWYSWTTCTCNWKKYLPLFIYLFFFASDQNLGSFTVHPTVMRHFWQRKKVGRRQMSATWGFLRYIDLTDRVSNLWVPKRGMSVLCLIFDLNTFILTEQRAPVELSWLFWQKSQGLQQTLQCYWYQRLCLQIARVYLSNLWFALITDLNDTLIVTFAWNFMIHVNGWQLIFLFEITQYITRVL